MACDQTGWRTLEGELDREDVRDLLALHVAEMRADSPPEACHVLPGDALRDPAIRFLSVRDPDGLLLGVGALKRLSPRDGEVKSMRTAPAALGRGVGRRLLEELVAQATALGLRTLWLETGNSARFAAARRLYESNGFRQCGPFGDYADTPFTHFYTRNLLAR